MGSSVAPAEGLSVAGKYRLIRPLARGSMGEVWIASHETLGGELAIKFMTQQTGPDNEDPETAMARFQFEAQVAARLSRRSRHIVAVTDHGHEWGHAYLVMEFVEGEALADVIRRQAPLDLSLVATLTSQLAKGLAQAHMEGLFHRDLKPANVLLTRDEDGGVLAKILDFGIAKATRRHQVAPSASNMPIAGATRPGHGHETEAGIVLGTPNYMSPEQARGLSTLDHRCDVWALGVIAYEALTGTLPYDGETTADLLVNICTTRSVPARTHNEKLPEAIEPFFRKAFAPKVAGRFQSAVDLGEALLSVAREAGRMPKIVTAPPPPPAAGQPASTHRSAQVPPASSIA
ncbi:MAG: serine/threonine-protein kinase [Polyangiales bacterium]